MTRIVGHIVTKNESDRFLQACLNWNGEFLDDLYVYEDQSNDSTVEVAKTFTENVLVRSDKEPAFLEDEGRFRQTAWDHMGKVLDLEEGDWVFAFDADEFLVGNHHDGGRQALELLIEFADSTNNKAVSIHRIEIWDQKVPYKQRIDGYWAKDFVPRLVRWQPKGKFKDAKLGCGSIPVYGLDRTAKVLSICNILHFGYSLEGEAKRKYDLYSELSGNAHSRKHIESIVQPPTLEPWWGPEPNIWRGIR